MAISPAARATSAPQRMTSASVVVRCERPVASRTIDSIRVVLPAAFGPQTRCGPDPKVASSRTYPRTSLRRSETSVTGLAISTT
jgi:hypothetical protein